MMPAHAMHWAHRLIGTPWTPEHNCWWLVRHYFAARHGVQLPALAIGAAGNAAALLRAARASGWQLVARNGEPQEDDVVLMRGPRGRRHAGVIIRADGRAGVLHSDGALCQGVPRGHVVFQPLADAAADGYRQFEFWRRDAPGAS